MFDLERIASRLLEMATEATDPVVARELMALAIELKDLADSWRYDYEPVHYD